MPGMKVSKKNISAIQAEKNIESCYKSSHRLMKLIRACMSDETLSKKLEGTIEVDEMFLGGGTKWSRWGSICKTRKQPILGFFERE